MNYVRIADPQPVVEYVVETLTSHLDKGESVLWLIPGGSAIKVAAAVSQQLAGHDLSKLHVTLTDERYGAIGHPDSNWQQLNDVGFQLPGAQLYPVLNDSGRAETTTAFAAYIQGKIQTDGHKIGLFGIGPDGHTAGVLPGSPAVTDTHLAADYDAGNYQRVTLTPAAISRLDEAVVYAMGVDKKPALGMLRTSLPLAEQPAQILKQIPKLTIFNDQINDEEES